VALHLLTGSWDDMARQLKAAAPPSQAVVAQLLLLSALLVPPRQVLQLPIGSAAQQHGPTDARWALLRQLLLSIVAAAAAVAASVSPQYHAAAPADVGVMAAAAAACAEAQQIVLQLPEADVAVASISHCTAPLHFCS